MLPYLKKGYILGLKNAGGSLGSSHLAFREKEVIVGTQKTAGDSLGTSHLAFREKGDIFWGPTNYPFFSKRQV